MFTKHRLIEKFRIVTLLKFLLFSAGKSVHILVQIYADNGVLLIQTV